MNCPELYLVALDASGAPVPGALLSSTVAGSSSIPKAVYSDAACTVEHPNPLPAGGDGVFPQFFLVDGGYRFALSYPDGAQLRPPRDYVNGASSGGSGTSDHKVLASDADGTGGYLDAKVENSTHIDLSIDPVTQKIKATLSAAGLALAGKVSIDGMDAPGFLASKLAPGNAVTLTPVAGAGGSLRIDVDASALPDKRVAVTSTDSPGYLTDKVMEGAGMDISTVASVGTDKAILIRHRGNILSAAGDTKRVFLSDAIKDSDSVSWSRTVTNGTTELRAEVVTPADGKVAVTSGDPPGYLNAKLKAGAGVTLTPVVDAVDGMQLWIDSKANFWSPVKTVNVDTYNATDADATIVARYPGGVCNVILPEANASRKGRSYRVVNQSIGIYAGESVEVKAYNGVVHGSGLTSLLAGEVGNYTCLPMTSGSNAIVYIWMAW